MNETDHTTPPLPGTRLKSRETEGQLSLHLPARPDRAAIRILGMTATVVGVWIAAYFYARATGLTLLPPFLGALGFIVLLLSTAYFCAFHCTDISILLTPTRLTVTSALFGKRSVEQHTLTEQSQAWRLRGRNSAGRYRRTGGGSVMQWVEINVAGGECRFGYGLRTDESEWVVSRINAFLNRPIDPDAPTPHG